VLTVWWCVLGLLLATYFALAGYDYGVGMLLPSLGGDEPGQRRLLGAVGPFFLANEVWLIAAVGLLFGAFPHLEGKVLADEYLVVVLLLAGLVTFTAAVQLRSRRPDGSRRGWTAAIVGGAAIVSACWGLFLGNLVLGLPDSNLFNPYAVLWGLGIIALFALHGATFLTVRGSAEITAKARRLAIALVSPVLVFVLVASGWGAAVPRVRDGVTAWAPAVAIVGLAAVALVRWALGTRRYRIALLGSMLLSALPVVEVGMMRFPRALPSLEISQAAADSGTLTLLGWFTAPALVAILAVQGTTWWANRGRVDDRSLLHF
jgi:cytochrome d ubiquinol oxidase subunit II